MAEPHVIDVRISDLRQLFNSFDPSPFHEKDLDRDAEEYIVGWANELPLGTPLELVVRVPADQVETAQASDLGRAIANYFSYRATESRRAMRFLFREGRVAMAIGLAFLVACMALRELATAIDQPTLRPVLQEGLVILGWVAMWRPLQIFLYDWWPVRHYLRLYAQLAGMSVRVVALPVESGAPQRPAG
jgi:hypothetical protein